MLPGLASDHMQLTLRWILDRAGRQFPRTELVTRTADGEIQRSNYGDLYGRTQQLAHALEALGVRPGDRVASLCWNDHRHLELYFGVPITGAVLHTLNARLHEGDLTYIANDAADKVLFVHSSLLEVYERFRNEVRIEHVIVIPDEGTTPDGYLDYEDFLAGHLETYEGPELDERQAAIMCHTSGTTGNPKGVLYSHRSTTLHTFMACLADTIGFAERDCFLPVVPLYHANAWGQPLAAAFAGSKQVFPGRDLSAEALLNLIDAERVTITSGVPTVFLSVLQAMDAEPDRWDVSSIRTIVCGGSAVPRSLFEGFGRHDVEVTQAWGMTEMNSLGSVATLKRHQQDLDPAAQLDARVRQGHSVPLVEFRHVDDEGHILPWDGASVGELEVRGPTVAAGYYGIEPDERFTPDGWFKTGDMVTIDEQGSMEVTDRAKDMVKSGGEWISSVALENALMSHPAVFEAAVFAARHERWDERPLAAVVLQPGQTATAEHLRAHLEPSFARWELPDAYLFLDEIPKTATGKFRKTELRERFGDYLIEGGKA